ncbi:hypothetical protein FOZ60_007917 [Perkinsus olseni]|uniref:Uncharacterized protein n=1 Tax=Perkinsus olseni TaxID=32597 RepID=A0A7J6NL18_PEROL|nr:hypothetical protein FOZ60_007917 [Perkinsus olseni]
MSELKRPAGLEDTVSPRGSKRARSATESRGPLLDDASSDDGGLDGLMGLVFDDELAAGLDDSSGIGEDEEMPIEKDFTTVEDVIEPQVSWTSPPLLDRYTLCVVQDGGAELTVPMTWYRERDPGDTASSMKETPDSPHTTPSVLPQPVPEVPVNTPGKFDPRFIEVCDHDGRGSQYQHWLTHGCIWKSGLICTMDQERSDAEVSGVGVVVFSLAEIDIFSLGEVHIVRMGYVLVVRDCIAQQLRAVTSAATAAAKRSAHPMPAAANEKEKSHQMRREWDKQVNKLGKQLMIAMGYRGLNRDNRLNEWCAWLGVKLTYIGLSNNSYSKLPGVVPTGAVGDIDLCGNGLEDGHLHVLASTLKPFNRLRVKVLRLSQNNITDGGLELLLSYPYLQALHLDRNKLTGGQHLLHFIVNAVAQLRETRHSQSDLEWRSLPPLWINLDGNYIQDSTELIRQLTGEPYGLVVCHPERTGCEPSALCRVYGDRCDVHIECLGCQRPIEDIKYHESSTAPVDGEAATVIDMTPTEVADVVDLEDD